MPGAVSFAELPLRLSDMTDAQMEAYLDLHARRAADLVKSDGFPGENIQAYLKRLRTTLATFRERAAASAAVPGDEWNADFMRNQCRELEIEIAAIEKALG